MWGIIGTALSLAQSAFDSYTVVSTGKRQPMKLIGWCVFFMKRTACAVRAPSHSSLTGWLLSGLLSFSPLWLEPGNANDEKLLFPLFLRTYPCCFQVESRQSWAEAIQHSHSLQSGAVSALKMDTVHWILVQPQTLYHFVVPNSAGTEGRVPFGELWDCWRNALVVRLLEISSKLIYYFLKVTKHYYRVWQTLHFFM